MNNKDIFNGIYDDFFGIEKSEKNVNINKDFPKIEVRENNKNEIESKTLTAEDKDNEMKKFFQKIEELYITDESKNTLKKMIEYMRKYNEQIEKQYIPFNMCVYTNNKETIYSISYLIGDAAEFFKYIPQGDMIEISWYDVEKVEQFEKVYSKENNLVLIKDFEYLKNIENNLKEKLLHKLEENIFKQEQNFINIIFSKDKEIVKEIFEENEILKENFDFEIEEINPDIQDVYQDVKEKLEEYNNLKDEFLVKLLDYITVTYPNTNLSFEDYKNKLIKKILFSKDGDISEKDLPEYEKEKTMDEVFAELNELVGLKNVKQVLQDLVSLIELKNKTKDDLKIKDTNLHMVFLGNPGTGKTTVARLIAQILYNLKYIKQNKLIEVSSKDLVAEYVGQTGPKTMKVIEKALGGVLFIDEAYSLASGNGEGNSFNEEAIATLIQAMENYRDNLVVIFAGYTKEMQDFLNANSGIVSRIGYTLEFADYTTDELIEIFKSMVLKAGFEIKEDAIEEVRKIINEYKDTKNFGNARFVRSLYEKTVIKHAANTKNKKSKKILKTIDKNDINAENLLKM